MVGFSSNPNLEVNGFITLLDQLLTIQPCTLNYTTDFSRFKASLAQNVYNSSGVQPDTNLHHLAQHLLKLVKWFSVVGGWYLFNPILESTTEGCVELERNVVIKGFTYNLEFDVRLLNLSYHSRFILKC